jgi:photosystem II stability/assembly factor-like uncharacterized protein
MRAMVRRLLLQHAIVCFLFVSSVTPALAQRGAGPPQAQPVAPLRFQYMGPESAGRIASVAGVPGDPNIYYAGAASGGIWKTTDGGKTFEPVFDDQPAQAIGALAVAPSNPSIVWAGTGEAWTIRPSDVMGDGVYKSTDAGKTWKNIGLVETGRITRILTHPTDSETAYVCALGRTTGPQQERGVFKTADGGSTWKRVLFVDPNTGCSGISMDAKNPDILLAGTWEVKMQTHLFESGGPGSGVYLTRNGGATWTKVKTGMPKPPVGKIDVAIAPSDSKRMYALIQTPNQGSLWRSDDAGTSWRVVSWDRTLIGRAGYYINIKVNPANADDVMVLNSSFHRSTDGGLTFPGTGGCGDCHDIWIDPGDGKRYVMTDDGGMAITTNNGANYANVRLPIGQMYHVAIDNRVPYWIYSNRQDDGTMRGPSTVPVQVANVPSYSPQPAGGAGRGGGGGFGGGRGGGGLQWEQGIGGCESGFTMPVPGNPDVIWATCYGNEVTRYDARTRRARSVTPWMHTLDSEPTRTKYRCHWTPPLAFDPFEPETVYYGCQVIFKTSTRGETWDVISPDLSTQDPSRIVFSGGVVGDNLGQFYGAVIYAIAPSKIQRGLIWAGTNDGKIWNTRDGGKNWSDITNNVKGMIPWGTITKIEPSSFDAGTAYVVVDYHIMDNRDPHIYRTSDFGSSWTKISDALPRGPLAYTLSFAENPNRQGMLFAGTGNAFYYSLDDGKTWKQFKTGLPAAPVTWIEVQKRAHDIVVSTYGRGLYILRDITRLEQEDRVSSSTTVLYSARNGVREARGGSADFIYSLPEGVTGQVQFEILDQSGKAMRTWSVPARAGLNRVVWDLRSDGPRQIALRTIPPDNPHIWEEARFKGRDTRPIIHWGIQNPQRVGAIAAPGTYSVRMTIAGQQQTKTFEIEKDPSIPSSTEDIAENSRVQQRMVGDINQTADMVNQLEVIRKQIEDQMKAQKGNAFIVKALTELDRKAIDVELQLLSRTELHSDDKWYVEAYKVYLNLIWHYGVIGTGAGDVQGGADYRPTAASMKVLEEIEAALAKAKSDYDALIQKELPAFNKSMAGKVPPIGISGSSF